MIDSSGPQMQVAGYRLGPHLRIHLYRECATIPWNRRDSMTMGLYTMRNPQREVCRDCYHKYRRGIKPSEYDATAARQLFGKEES